ncbi:MAG TPA: RecQ family zinc-binding domain-containing protein, partial [Prolixibacteraceae bacterium]|nr:RecQ family zinc-binding domain-containing protein [Prolixibacteraceae bacterium]
LLAARAATTPDVIVNFLKQLHNQRIIDYVPRRKSPYIYFSRDRVELERLLFSPENYDLRKQDFKERIGAVIHYASSTLKCRSQMLLAYFGETDSQRCGICDVCLERNQLGLSRMEFDRYREAIREGLQEPLLPEELLFRLGPGNESLREVLRWLMDHGKIVRRIDNRLEWKSEK